MVSKWFQLSCVLPLFVRLVGPVRAPPWALRVGSILSGAFVCGYGYATSPGMLFGFVGGMSFGIMSLPAIRSMLSAGAHPSRQGQVVRRAQDSLWR